jgi:group I intron endonuclease
MNNSKKLYPVYLHAIKIYEDPLNQRDLIREENNEKIGIYCWINKKTEKFYIGSGDPLYLRISDYYQSWYYLSHSNLYIVRALFKYGMSNFSLVILEYCKSDDLIKCEQKWIDQLKPEYNINPTAGNTKGYKHTIEAIEKMR